MIAGIGVDIVSCERLRPFLEDQKKGLRFFHPEEYDYAAKNGTGALQSLAAAFGAKEAFGKALGTGLAGLNLADIQVAHTTTGKPELILWESAREAADRLGVTAVHLSLSHEQDTAVAFVILEK